MNTTKEGIRYELVGSKLHLQTPEGMTVAEAMMVMQARIDKANALTGLEIQMVLPDEGSAWPFPK